MRKNKSSFISSTTQLTSLIHEEDGSTPTNQCLKHSSAPNTYARPSLKLRSGSRKSMGLLWRIYARFSGSAAMVFTEPIVWTQFWHQNESVQWRNQSISEGGAKLSREFTINDAYSIFLNSITIFFYNSEEESFLRLYYKFRFLVSKFHFCLNLLLLYNNKYTLIK